MREDMTAKDKFISDVITPVKGTFDIKAMSRGEPGMPSRFKWRKRVYAVAEVIEKWKETSPRRGGSGEKYVRKHWYKIRTTEGEVMEIYFERKSVPKGQAKRRWWLYSVSSQ